MRNISKRNLLIVTTIIATYLIVQILRDRQILKGFHEITLASTCINIILASSLNLITGFTGQFSLGHAGFMSIGAYTCALIIIRNTSVYGFIVGILAGAVFAAIVGVLIGIPTLRLKGDYLAIATLGMAEIIKVIFFNLRITNGAAGLMGIPRLANWSWLFFTAVATVILINNFIHSSHGRACLSIREDEIAAESMGINTTLYKITAFSLGAFFAGIGGALYASYFYLLKPEIFGFLKSIDILVIVVLGGMGSLTGSVVTAILLTVLTTLLQDFASMRMIVYAVLLIIMMLFRPQGLLGNIEINELFNSIPIPGKLRK